MSRERRLPAGYLRCFPVEYPACWTPRDAPPVHPAGSKLIAFGNTFQDPWVGGGPHNAIDILGAEGLEVVSTTYGQVVDQWHLSGTHSGADQTPNSGNLVVIMDAAGFVHHYYHLRDRPILRAGDILSPGDFLGYLGRTGIASGSAHHLHYQVRGPEGTPSRLLRLEGIFDGRIRLRGQGGPPYNPYYELERLAMHRGWHREGRRIVIDHQSSVEP